MARSRLMKASCYPANNPPNIDLLRALKGIATLSSKIITSSTIQSLTLCST